MAITIGGYPFEGPYTSVGDLKDHSGIYAIICDHEGKKYLLDIGESSVVKEAVKNHMRMQRWIRDCYESCPMQSTIPHVFGNLDGWKSKETFGLDMNSAQKMSLIRIIRSSRSDVTRNLKF